MGGVLPGSPRARLAPSTVPRGAARAGGGWGRRPRRDPLIPLLTPTPSAPGGALLGSPESPGRMWPAPRAGPQRSPPARGAHDRGRRPCKLRPPRIQSPLDLVSPRGGRSDHDVKGAGQTVREGHLPGGGAIRSVPSPRTPRAAPAVAWAGWLTPTAEPWLDPEAREGRARRGPGRRSLTPGAGCPGSRSPCDLRAAERAGERTAGASWGRKRVATGAD